MRVIPFTAGGLPGAGQSFTYVAAPVAQLDTVQLDSSHGLLLRGLALAADESRAFIRTIAQDR
ncbi:hypothetical protein ACH4M4_27325 [Streptomyces sp. NPDC017254]|uniref:hypothetical protein n=1 Tax=unclassified Streptomyces TaxID=2593676 RepID=UPI0037A560A2